MTGVHKCGVKIPKTQFDDPHCWVKNSVNGAIIKTRRGKFVWHLQQDTINHIEMREKSMCSAD